MMPDGTMPSSEPSIKLDAFASAAVSASIYASNYECMIFKHIIVIDIKTIPWIKVDQFL